MNCLSVMNIDVLFVRHATVVEYVPHMREIIRVSRSSKCNLTDLPCFCMVKNKKFCCQKKIKLVLEYVRMQHRYLLCVSGGRLRCLSAAN